jgi:hypothetical protein
VQRVVQKLAKTGVLHFAEPVHEEITGRIYDCDHGCNDVEAAAEWAGAYTGERKNSLGLVAKNRPNDTIYKKHFVGVGGVQNRKSGVTP